MSDLFRSTFVKLTFSSNAHVGPVYHATWVEAIVALIQTISVYVVSLGEKYIVNITYVTWFLTLLYVIVFLCRTAERRHQQTGLFP